MFHSYVKFPENSGDFMGYVHWIILGCTGDDNGIFITNLICAVVKLHEMNGVEGHPTIMNGVPEVMGTLTL